MFRPCCLPTAVGSLPHTDPAEACDLILRHLPEIPVWPQLPNRAPVESMYVQFFERLPGAIVEGDKVCVDGPPASALEQLYGDYLGNDAAGYALSGEWAAGFAEMRQRCRSLPQPPFALKGQVTGPISAGLQITDRAHKPLLYDEVLADALAKYLRLAARAQEQALRECCPRTVVFLDEPYLSAVGSAFIQIRPEQVDELLAEVLGGLEGLTGVHCCGNTDWSLVLRSAFDILSFDAYNFAETLSLYADDVRRFLDRGGILAWGIIPTDPRALAAESAESLVARLLDAVSLLSSRGIDREQILVASLITPSCGLGPLSPPAALRALSLTAEVSRAVRRDHLPSSVLALLRE